MARRKPRLLWPFANLDAIYPGLTNRQIGDLLGVSRDTVIRWRRDGIPDRSSDRVAVSLGRHPEQVWPGWTRAGVAAAHDVEHERQAS